MNSYKTYESAPSYFVQQDMMVDKIILHPVKNNYDDKVIEKVFSAQLQLDQPIDDGTFFKVLALIYDFRIKKNDNAVNLQEPTSQAYEEVYSLNKLKNMASFAEWQGMAYSEHWNQIKLDRLIKRLKQSKLHRLAAVPHYMLPKL